MHSQSTSLKDVFLITPTRHGDDRGFFSETFSQRQFDELAPGIEFVQDNHAFSADKGVIRGLHFQAPPMAQGKLVRVTRGVALDVVVDIRKGSPTYGRHQSFELSADNWHQLWVPAGFAHAYCTLVENTEFLYKVTNYYSPEHDGGIRFDDPDLAIKWPFPADQVTLSDKDQLLPTLRDLSNPFIYGENC